MNPTISPEFLEKQCRRNEEKFRREYLAEFTDHINCWVGSETIEACVLKDRKDLPPIKNVTYAAAIDPVFSETILLSLFPTEHPTVKSFWTI